MINLTITGHALKALIRRLPHDGTPLEHMFVHVTEGGMPVMWCTDRYQAFVYSDRPMTPEGLLMVVRTTDRLGSIHLDDLQKITKLEKPAVPITLSFGTRGFEAARAGDTGDASCVVEPWSERDGSPVQFPYKEQIADLEWGGPIGLNPKLMEALGHLGANLGVGRDTNGRKESPYTWRFLGSKNPPNGPLFFYIKSGLLGDQWGSTGKTKVPLGEAFACLALWMPVRLPKEES